MAGPLVQVAAARLLASALVLGIEQCAAEDAPLSGAQTVALVEAALLEFDGFEDHATTLVALDAMLRELDVDRRKD